ncbi:uncharacterized protein LOC133325076 [Musca vetustissima]|uniref:uncharacterized protein LOC133325076 n=1 Tax=Musca vetustissima TaxID=27455 RepID=UPI002AB6C8D6|nr:uncharacterized protein LOC133325076 [Musca vetustissima]
MKFAVFALVAALCLVAVNANAVGFTDDFPTDFVPSDFVDDEFVDIEQYHIFSTFWWITKAALRTLKGVNCSIKQVMKIKDAALNFLPSIHGCGADATKAYANIITTTQNVINTCNAIIQTNEEVCNNDESTNGKPSTPKACFTTLLKQFYTLNKQIKAVKTAIKKVPSIPSDAADCANQAVNDLTSPMTIWIYFGIFVKEF